MGSKKTKLKRLPRVKGGRDRAGFGLTREEKAELKELARRKGMTLSYYIIWSKFHDWL